MRVHSNFDPAKGFIIMFLRTNRFDICRPLRRDKVLENIIEELKRK
jgi:hypothetical protein